VIAIVVSAAMTVGAASAQMAGSTVQVAGRVATFLQPGLSGQVTAAIVYQPGDTQSEDEARTIERALGSGLVIGALRLRPRRVPISALDQLGGAKVAFVTRGTNYRAVAAAAAPLSILTISSDPACAQAGYCVVTISSTPRVQITVSKAAGRAAGLRFSSGFLMLIKEI
jgi:hypothetical protein